MVRYMQASHLQLSVQNENLFFLFLNQNIWHGYSKEPSHWDNENENLFFLFPTKIYVVGTQKNPLIEIMKMKFIFLIFQPKHML